MANMKEIQDRIRSIQDTMKITNAMYMISSSKMKKAQKVLKDTEPYFYAMQDAISRVLRHAPEIDHVYFEGNSAHKKEGKDKNIGYIVITGDKGMAGAYNHNVIKLAEQKLQQEGNVTLFVLGELGRHYFARKNVKVDTSVRYTVQHPTVHRARSIALKMLELYDSGELDEVHIIYTVMESAVSMEAKSWQLLPLKKQGFGKHHMNLEDKELLKQLLDVHQEVITMSPSPEAVMEAVVPQFLIGTIYGCLVESYCSEHNSRMIAMESSTKSAKEMLNNLSIMYNRARQAAITQEITEVIGGAKAQKRKQNS